MVIAAAWTATEWNALAAMLSGIGTICGAGAVAFAAHRGSKTFDEWRKQKLAERRIEQAERILTATYKVRRGLSHVRNPVFLPHELQAAEDHLKEKGELPGDEQGSRKKTTAQAYFSRLNTVLDDRKALDECLAMARTLFGERVEKAMVELNSQFHLVNVAVMQQFWFDDDTDRAFRKEIEATLWAGYPAEGEDQIARKVAELVGIIQRACDPVLRLEGNGRLAPGYSQSITTRMN